MRFALAALCTVSHALAPSGHRAPPTRPVEAELGRRDLLLTLGAAGLLPRRALAANPEGTVVPQAELFETAAKVARKRIIVTGANSGVGLEGAKILAKAGHDVVCACRNQARADAAASATGGTAAVCDLADLSSVRSFAKTVSNVDVLVLNAGLALNTKDKEPTRTKDGFELTIGTNHLGHFLLYNFCLLYTSPSPRDMRRSRMPSSA